MNPVYTITSPASRDVERIANYLAENSSLERSDRFLQGITIKLKRLAQFPQIGRSRDDLSPLLRSLSYESYLIFYRTKDASIEILRVVSGYQDLNELFGSEE